MVILSDIDKKKRKKIGHNKNKLWTLREYIEIAERCILAFGKNYAKSMIKNEDAISYVASDIMMGHCAWNKNGGRTLKSYLNQCAIWSILKWKTRVYKNCSKQIKTSNIKNLDSIASKDENLINTISKKENDLFYIILNKFDLTEKQKECIRNKFFQNKSVVQISKELNISRQAVSEHIKKGLNKIKNSDEEQNIIDLIK